MNNELFEKKYLEITEKEKNIYEMYKTFCEYCNKFKEINDNKFKLQTSLEMNKVFFQGFIVDSSLVSYLNEQEDKSYGLEEINALFEQYEKDFNQDIHQYQLALLLYNYANKIEDEIDEKVKLEMKLIFEYSVLIDNINDIEEVEYNNLCEKIEYEINNKYLVSNLISEDTFDKIMNLLKDVIEYHKNDYGEIPFDIYVEYK